MKPEIECSDNFRRLLESALPNVTEFVPKASVQELASTDPESGQTRKNVIRVNARYKTEMCHQFVEVGYCQYEDRCVYAHGIQELKQNKNRHRNYRTRVCTAFNVEGFCSFGSRCAFIHLHCNPMALIESTVKACARLRMPDNPNREPWREFWPRDTLYRKVDSKMVDEYYLLPSTFVSETYKRLPSFVKLTKSVD